MLAKILRFPSFRDHRGELFVVESEREIPFALRRIYYITHVPKGERRGQHAHRERSTVYIAVHGTFSLLVEDGFQKQEYSLSTPDEGLYVPPLRWIEVFDFSPDGVCLALASDLYDPNDYITKYDDFLALVRGAGASGA